jgi:hypothetical protein
MTLPVFDDDGDLPPGVHCATLAAVLERFGQGSVQRCAMADRLSRLYELVKSTGHLTRFVVFGSFITTKIDPNDVDIFLLMEDSFNLASVTTEAALVFQHMEQMLILERAFFGASARGPLVENRL